MIGRSNSPPEESRHANATSPIMAAASACGEIPALSMPRLPIAHATTNGAATSRASRRRAAGSKNLPSYPIISPNSERNALMNNAGPRPIPNKTHTAVERARDVIVSRPRISQTKRPIGTESKRMPMGILTKFSI